MDGTGSGPFALLTTLPDPAAADLCAALLRSAGIEARLQGESQGPYRLTIGRMALTQVWVPAALVDEARSLLEAAAEDETPGPWSETDADSEEAPPPRDGAARWWPLVAGALLALVAWQLLGRLL